MNHCMRCLVSGKVQGVWFRSSTRDQAQRLGLRGSAINLADGRVEVIACGEQDRLERLHAWLHQGPAGARVEQVVCAAVPDPGLSGFTTGG